MNAVLEFETLDRSLDRSVCSSCNFCTLVGLHRTANSKSMVSV